ncbi:MAG: hypothetical protein R3C12_09220 [Planctomycetaceae bacterium]
MNVSRVEKCLQSVTQAARQGQLTAGAVTNLTRWLSEPHYARYHEGLCGMIEAEQFNELDSLFWEVIAFGTGGRRGPMAEFGSATINPRTIAESAHGLATYLKRSGEWKSGKAVVACDTRNGSREFARLTASVFAAHGMTVYFFPQARSTPELSFAVRHLGCDTGVMITASHNPPADNGFKAYWNTGGQVLPLTTRESSIVFMMPARFRKPISISPSSRVPFACWGRNSTRPTTRPCSRCRFPTNADSKQFTRRCMEWAKRSVTRSCSKPVFTE